MCRARQSDAVLDHIGTAVGYRPDMRSLNFGPAAAVDDPQPCHRATVIVGLTHVPPEAGVTNLPIQKDLFDAPFLLLDRRVE